MNRILILSTLALSVLLAGCAPSAVGTMSGTSSGTSAITTSAPATTSGITTTRAPQPTTRSCAGQASGTFSNARSTLDVTINAALGSAFGTFSINGKSYSVSGTASPIPGGLYLDLDGVVDGGRVTGNLLSSFSGNYKATINNYRLSMTCTG